MAAESHVRSGHVTALRLYDVAYAIDLGHEANSSRTGLMELLIAVEIVLALHRA